MIVVDVNLIAYLLIPGKKTATAERVLRKDPGWVTSSLWLSEFRNVVTQYLRQGILEEGVVLECLEEAESRMAGCEYVVSSPSVMRKVIDSNCSAYDCEYVALAEELGVPLVTADRRILKAFPRIAMSPEAFVDGARG